MHLEKRKSCRFLLIHRSNLTCFAGTNLILLIVGSVLASILVTMVMFASLATVNLAPVPYDLFAVSTPIYRVYYYCALMLMTIDENLIALAIPNVGRWWESVFNLLIVSALVGLVVYYLPFQVFLLNHSNRLAILGKCFTCRLFDICLVDCFLYRYCCKPAIEP